MKPAPIASRPIALRIPIDIHTGMPPIIGIIRCTTSGRRRPTMPPTEPTAIDTEGIGTTRSGNVQIITARIIRCTTSGHRPPTMLPTEPTAIDTEGIGMTPSGNMQIIVPRRRGTSTTARRRQTSAATGTRGDIPTLGLHIGPLDRRIVKDRRGMTEEKTAALRVDGSDGRLRPLRMLMSGDKTIATLHRPLRAATATKTN